MQDTQDRFEAGTEPVSEKAEIGEELNKIIGQRWEKARVQQEREARLGSQIEELKKLQVVNGVYHGISPEDRSLLFGSRQVLENLDRCGELLPECIAGYEAARKAVHTLGERYKRKTINITVIGKIGAGKSKFLQSASGIRDDCIPSYSGPSCTGVTSILENAENGGTRAILSFKTEEEVLRDFNRELENAENAFRDMVRQNRSQEDGGQPVLTKLDRNAIGAALKNLKDRIDAETNKHDVKSPLRNMLLRQSNNVSNLHKIYYDNWSEWSCFVGLDEAGARQLQTVALEPGPDGTFILNQQEEIKTFVSKHDGKKNDFYRFCAVKKAVVQTKFESIDARIRLLDTVGIGDTASDTKIRMQEAIRDESDGVIFILISHLRTEDSTNAEVEDVPVLAQLQELYSQYQGKKAAYWMMFLVNPIPVKDIESRQDAESYLESLKSPNAYGGRGMLGETNIRIKEVVDAGNPKEVEEILKRFLGQLRLHLPEVDRCLEEQADELCRQAAASGRNLWSRLCEVSAASSAQRTLSFVSNAMKPKLEALKESLKSCCLGIARENSTLLRNRLEEVKRIAEGGEAEGRSLDQIIAFCRSKDASEGDIRNHAFEELNMVVRQIGLTSPATPLSKEREIRKKVADCFVDCLGLELSCLGFGSDSGIAKSRADFFSVLADAMFSDIPDVDEMQQALTAFDRSAERDEKGMVSALFNYYAATYLNPVNALSLQPYANASGEGGGKSAADKAAESDPWAAYTQNNADKDRYGGEKKESGDDAELKQEMRKVLKQFIDRLQTLADANEKEQFLISGNDRMKSEILNSLIYLNQRYEKVWLMVFQKLYEQGAVLQSEGGRMKKLAVEAQKIAVAIQTFRENAKPDGFGT